MSKLKPCPLCGKTLQAYVSSSGYPNVWCTGGQCGLRVEGPLGMNVEDVRERANRRAVDPAGVERVAGLLREAGWECESPLPDVARRLIEAYLGVKRGE